MGSRTVEIPDKLFMTSLNENESWVLGLFLTDGNITKPKNTTTWEISLSSKDRDVIDKTHEIVSVGNVRRQNYSLNRGFGWKWSVKSKELGNRLLNWNLAPRKSLTLTLPSLENIQISSFVRGLWDGDGSIVTSTDTRHPIEAKICSASYEFVEALRLLLKSVTFSDCNIKKDKRRESFYTLAYSSGPAKRLIKWMYNGSKEENRMNRKYDKALEFLL